jgi:hypothetical protein
MNNFNKLKQYINDNNKLPSQTDKNKEIKFLGMWISTQKKKYKIRKEIMKDDIIYNKFKDFLQTYSEYIISNEDKWYVVLEKVIKYINENNKLPSEDHSNKEIKYLGVWISTQKANFKKHNHII